MCLCTDVSLFSLSLKVTITIIDFQPEFSHISIPRLSPHSFLQAKVKNVSSYALLAGPANVFLDNNFLAKVKFINHPQDHQSIHLSINPSTIHWSVHPAIHSSSHIFVHPSIICRSVHSYIHFLIHPSIHHSLIHPIIHPFIPSYISSSIHSLSYLILLLVKNSLAVWEQIKLFVSQVIQLKY